MSVLVAGNIQTEWTKITDNSATVIFTAPKRTTITAIAASENNGSTPTLRIWRTASATDYDIRSTLAVTARQRVLIDEVLSLNQGDELKAQSSDGSGRFDVTVSYLAPSALANGR